MIEFEEDSRKNRVELYKNALKSGNKQKIESASG